MIRMSIWEDVYYTASTSDLKFTVTDDSGNVIYSGRAIAKPSTEYAVINISRILQGFLDDNAPDDWDFTTFTNAKGHRVFHLMDYSGESGLEDYDVIYCWDYKTMYDSIWDVSNYSLSKYPNDHTRDGMHVFGTTISTSGLVTTVTQVGVGNSCGDAAIYYISPKGGWVGFLIEGNIQRTNDYERYGYTRYANANSMQFGKNTHTNTITSSWELKTHLMGDEESLELSNGILQTPKAYLHLFKENRIVPIVIDTDTIKCLTYKGNGYKMFGYTIKVTESQERQMM